MAMSSSSSSWLSKSEVSVVIDTSCSVLDGGGDGGQLRWRERVPPGERDGRKGI